MFTKKTLASPTGKKTISKKYDANKATHERQKDMEDFFKKYPNPLVYNLLKLKK